MIQPAPESASISIDGPEVRRRRKILGQNIAPFAARCGITETYLSAIELKRRKRVSPKVFGQICDALGLDEGERPQLVCKQSAPAAQT